MILSAPKSEKYGIKLESLACFYAILDTCVYLLCVCRPWVRAGVPDLPAEEDCCSLGASERREGGEESVCQRGTVITQQSCVRLRLFLRVQKDYARSLCVCAL